MATIELTSKKAKSYASEGNLKTALSNYGLSNLRHVVCKTVEGRWTALFLNAEGIPAAHCGFMVVGSV